MHAILIDFEKKLSIPLHLEVTPGNLGGKEGGDSFLPEGLCAAFGPRWVGHQGTAWAAGPSWIG